MFFTETSGKFVPGNLKATRTAIKAIPRKELLDAYCRHLNCDWGDVDDFDWKQNLDALKTGERLVSEYHTTVGERFYIITEADRSETMILLPTDY